MSASNINGRLAALAAGLVLAGTVWSGTAGADISAPVPLLPQGVIDNPDDAPAPPRKSEPSIQVDDLAAIGPGSVGLLDETNGGLGVDMWSGTRLGLVQKALPNLPAATTSRAMRQLMRRLLLTTAAVPAGKGSGESLLKLRLDRLYAMGDIDSMLALIKAAPVSAMTPDIRRLRVDGLLLNQEPGPACAELPALLKAGPDPAVGRLQVFCQLQAGKTADAAIGVDLLREQGQTDPIFISAVEALQGTPSAELPSLANPTPLQIAMLRAAKKTLPDDLAQAGHPAIVKAVALSPNASLDLRLAAAEKAEAYGALDTEVLRQLYSNVSFTQEELDGPLTQAAQDKGVRRRALLFRAAAQQQQPGAKAEIIARALGLARDRGYVLAAARLYAPLIAQIKPAPELVWFAGHAARAQLAAGHPEAARPWIALVRQQAAGNNEAAAIQAGLWPLLRLGDVDENKPRPEASLAAWRKLKSDLPPDQADRRTAVLLGLLDAVGENIGSEDWLGQMDGGAPVQVSMPRPAYWHGLRYASDNVRQAETILMALLNLGEAGDLADPVTLYRTVSALRLIGLDAEARGLAVEAAIVNGI